MPSISEAVRDVGVKSFMKQMWEKTQQSGNEWGGWIYYDTTKRAYGVKSKTSNNPNYVTMTGAPEVAQIEAQGHEITFDFHCHPATGKSAGTPSGADMENAQGLHYARLVITPPIDYKKLNASVTSPQGADKYAFNLNGIPVSLWVVRNGHGSPP